MEGKILSIRSTRDLQKHSGVYKIGFKGTDNFYIGSSNNIGVRLRYHRSRLKRGIHENPCLTNAFNKYGIDNCFIEVMKICNTDETRLHEQYFIDTLKPEYNIAKLVEGGRSSKLSIEDVLKIRWDYYNRLYREEVQEIADRYNLSADYITSIASGSCLGYIENPPELQEHIDKNVGKQAPLKVKKTSVKNYVPSVKRKLTEEQVGMIRWAMENNKSVHALYKYLGIKDTASLAHRLRKNIIYKEYQDLVDASHLNLPNAQVQRLTDEDIPKIRWAHLHRIPHNEIVRVFGCHFNTSCDIKMNRVYKHVVGIESCAHLFQQTTNN